MDYPIQAMVPAMDPAAMDPAAMDPVAMDPAGVVPAGVTMVPATVTVVPAAVAVEDKVLVPAHEGLPSVVRRRSFVRPQDTTEDDTTKKETQVTGIALQKAEEAKDVDEMKTE